MRLNKAFLFIFLIGCSDATSTPEPEPTGQKPGYWLTLCGCHNRSLPKQAVRSTSKCQSGKSERRPCTECMRGDTNCAFWCAYPYWEEVCL